MIPGPLERGSPVHWHAAVVPDYDVFAEFYDAVMGDRARQTHQLMSWIDEHLERPVKSVLELGCGTGSVLAGLSRVPSQTGLDRSAAMLAVARQKLPRARLVEGHIESFHLAARFDVILCVYDTINHLLDFAQWEKLFDRVGEHLASGGLFIFDVNTIGKLRLLGDSPPWVLDFEGNVLITDVEFDRHQMSTWDIRVFRAVEPNRYVLCREVIRELGVPLVDISSALRSRFHLLDEIDPDGKPATDESRRVHFVCRAL